MVVVHAGHHRMPIAVIEDFVSCSVTTFAVERVQKDDPVVHHSDRTERGARRRRGSSGIARNFAT